MTTSDFVRFPHTPHLAWLGPGRPRDDKVLAPREVDDLLSGSVVVEEKLDGANVGFSVGDDGILRAHNRGNFLDLDAPTGQWKPLKRWVSSQRYALADALGPDLILFGEWCYAVHSVRYTRLPDWFFAFDVYDRKHRAFWSADRRNALAQGLNIVPVPELGRGHFDLTGLKALLGQSQVTDGFAEGLYVRRELSGVLAARAKLVRAEFTQAIDQHWSKRELQANQIVGEAAAWQ